MTGESGASTPVVGARGFTGTGADEGLEGKMLSCYLGCLNFVPSVIHWRMKVVVVSLIHVLESVRVTNWLSLVVFVPSDFL